jgi:hypothetical protein
LSQLRIFEVSKSDLEGMIGAIADKIMNKNVRFKKKCSWKSSTENTVAFGEQATCSVDTGCDILVSEKFDVEMDATASIFDFAKVVLLARALIPAM